MRKNFSTRMQRWVIWSLSFLIFSLSVSPGYAATYFGEHPRGHQMMKFKGSYFSVYVPTSYDPDESTTLIIAFGRTPRDYALEVDRLKEYARVWEDEVDRRGYVVLVPFWSEIIIENNKHVEDYFLEMIRDAKRMYNAERTLLSGFGLGAVYAFLIASIYPQEFDALVTIGGTPLRSRVVNEMIQKKIYKETPLNKLPPVLLVYGQSDTVFLEKWIYEDRQVLLSRGVQADVSVIPDMGYEHQPHANRFILDWFERKIR